MFLGGSNFAAGTEGRHIMVIGAGFFAILFLLVYVMTASR
jgi:Na+-transporting methylmalonyl-CoA/oxaloacetate decarboxylase gamma subunit